MGVSDKQARPGARPTVQPGAPPARSVPVDEVVWHDLECGGYDADLALWRELADEHARPRGSAAILDIGAGTGRVAIDLAARGHAVTALEIRPELLAALVERADGLALEPVCADARTFSLPERDYALCVVPMQTLQLLGGVDARGAFLARARAHLRPGGMLCCALVTEPEPFDTANGDLPLTAERAHIDGRAYVSRPTRVLVEEATITIERERRILPQPGTVARDTVQLDRLVSRRCASRRALPGSARLAASRSHPPPITSARRW